MTISKSSTNFSGSVEPSDGIPSPTVTHYQQVAADVMAAFDEIAARIPRLEVVHAATASAVRRRVNVPEKFLATATSAVEQVPELSAVKKFDVSIARDTLQFLEAFRPVLDKIDALATNLKFTMDSRKAELYKKSLIVYSVAQGLSRDPSAGLVAAQTANMKRDLGRRGPRKAPAAPQNAAPASRAGGAS